MLPCYFLWDFSIRVYIFLGTGSFVLTTLLFPLVTGPLEKYQGKSKCSKRENKDYLQAHHYLIHWYLFFKAALCYRHTHGLLEIIFWFMFISVSFFFFSLKIWETSVCGNIDSFYNFKKLDDSPMYGQTTV